MISALIYFLADLYPWWGLPLAFIFAEMSNYYRRHGQRGKMVFFGAFSVILFGLTASYFWFNGLERLRPTMQGMERTLKNK